jgi:hypothetical protein
MPSQSDLTVHARHPCATVHPQRNPPCSLYQKQIQSGPQHVYTVPNPTSLLGCNWTSSGREGAWAIVMTRFMTKNWNSGPCLYKDKRTRMARPQTVCWSISASKWFHIHDKLIKNMAQHMHAQSFYCLRTHKSRQKGGFTKWYMHAQSNFHTFFWTKSKPNYLPAPHGRLFHARWKFQLQRLSWVADRAHCFFQWIKRRNRSIINEVSSFQSSYRRSGRGSDAN